jgi:hypothetical protein
MYDEDVLWERVAFRLTPKARRKLAVWARAALLPLVNLVYTLICQPIDAKEQQRGRLFEIELREGQEFRRTTHKLYHP